MVNSQQQNLDMVYVQNIKHITIPISEIAGARGNRFDASVYCTEGRAARLKLEKLSQTKFELTSLNPNDGFVKDCLYPSRFKRIYVDKQTGLEFLLPSQINEIYPKAEKYISPKTEVDIDNLKVKKFSLLLTRSGTIGNLTFVSDTLNGKIFSDDVIRTTFNSLEDVGYAYAFLKSKTGQDILTTNNYGAVVQHIEPSHLAEVQIPNPSKDVKKKIHDLITRSFSLRDESNRLIDESQKLLIDELKLPQLHELKQNTFGSNDDVTTFSISASKLNNRLDASYHVPIVESIEKRIAEHSSSVHRLADSLVSNKVFLPGRFKRVYVDEGHGAKFIGSKQIGELNPTNTKYLSLNKHEKELQELELKENMVLVSRSGTIGSIKIVPKHWEKWVINEHVIRIIPASNEIAGYLYAWLDTEYGQVLIKKHTFGAVVDEIDVKQLGEVPIPFVSNDKLTQINDLVLEANKKRYESYILEKEAIAVINNEVLN